MRMDSSHCETTLENIDAEYERKKNKPCVKCCSLRRNRTGENHPREAIFRVITSVEPCPALQLCFGLVLLSGSLSVHSLSACSSDLPPLLSFFVTFLGRAVCSQNKAWHVTRWGKPDSESRPSAFASAVLCGSGLPSQRALPTFLLTLF